MPTASTSPQLELKLSLLRFGKATNYLLASSAVATITTAEPWVAPAGRDSSHPLCRGTLMGRKRLIDFRRFGVAGLTRGLGTDSVYIQQCSLFWG